MPLSVVGQSPFGVIFQRPDGSQVTVPHAIARGILPMLAQNAPPAAAPDAPIADVPDAPLAAGAPDALGPADATSATPPAPPTDAAAPAAPAPTFRGVGAAPGPPPPAPASAPPLNMADLAPGQPPRDRMLAELKMTDLGQPQPGGGAAAAPARQAGAGSPDPGRLLLQTGLDASNAATAAGDAQARQIAEAGPKMELAARTALGANAAAHLDFQNYMTRVDQRSQALGAQLQALSQQRINPNAYIEGQSSIGKLGTLAGIIAGGYVSTRYGGKNEALDTVKGLIQQNIDAQVANLANKRGLAHDQMTLLQQDVARGMDVYTARTKATAVALEQTAQLIDAEGAKYKSDSIRATSAQKAAELRAEAAKTFASYRSQQAQTAASVYATNSANMRERNQLAVHSALGIMQGQLGYAEHIQGNQEKLQAAQMKAGDEQRKLTVPAPAFSTDKTGSMTVSRGAPMVAFSEKAAEDGRDLVSVTNNAIAAVQNYYRVIAENRGARGGPSATQGFQQMETARAAARDALFKQLGFKRNITEADLKYILDDELPPPQGILNIADPYAKLKGTLGGIARAYNAQGGSYFVNFQQLELPANGMAAPPPEPERPGRYVGRRRSDGKEIVIPASLADEN
jgi:hypothetical protein